MFIFVLLPSLAGDCHLAGDLTTAAELCLFFLHFPFVNMLLTLPMSFSYIFTTEINEILSAPGIMLNTIVEWDDYSKRSSSQTLDGTNELP